MPWLEGSSLGRPPWTDAPPYERLGELLADLHAATQALSAPTQRPGWGSYADAALPLAGGAARRTFLLAELAKVDPDVAVRFERAAAALEMRELPKRFAATSRRTIHADFAPWNVRLRRGRLTGLLDFELAHVDLSASDVAQSRRGYHDGVVRGYLRGGGRLSDAELANLDAFWLAAVLAGVWRDLEQQLARGAVTDASFPWTLAQLEKIEPYRG